MLLLQASEWEMRMPLPSTQKTFGVLLREIRESKGLTLEALAEKTGLTHVAIGDWERGKRQPKQPNILLVSEGLGVEPSALLLAAGFVPDSREIEYVTDPDEVQLLSSYRGVVSEAGKKYALDIIKAMKERDSSESIGKRSHGNGVSEGDGKQG